MKMEYSFPHYLLSKQSVDDRALNKDVLAALKASLSKAPLSVIEVGGGIGTMLARLLRWDLISQAEYTLVDEMDENIRFAGEWLQTWGLENGFSVELIAEGQLRIFNNSRDVLVNLVRADVFAFIAKRPLPADLLIAHAFLDLLPMGLILPRWPRQWPG